MIYRDIARYVKIQIEKDNSPCAVRSNIKRPTNRSDSMSSLFRKHCQQTTQLALSSLDLKLYFQLGERAYRIGR